MHRRMLLALPLLAVTPAYAWSDQDYGVSELRLGSARPGKLARALQARLGIPVLAMTLVSGDLVDALNKGHLEAAILDWSSLSRARTLMGERLTIITGGTDTLVTRTALPAPFRAAITAGLAWT